ncbi:hypothetical protein ACN38_g7749, partial [Penicillium nordicum]
AQSAANNMHACMGVQQYV